MNGRWWLCLATDGDVIVADRTPDFDRFLPVGANPPLTEREARAVAGSVCERAPNGTLRFVSDPKTQLDLIGQFRVKVDQAAKNLRKKP
jgi:hypothetical protein